MAFKGYGYIFWPFISTITGVVSQFWVVKSGFWNKPYLPNKIIALRLCEIQSRNRSHHTERVIMHHLTILQENFPGLNTSNIRRQKFTMDVKKFVFRCPTYKFWHSNIRRYSCVTPIFVFSLGCYGSTIKQAIKREIWNLDLKNNWLLYII